MSKNNENQPSAKGWPLDDPATAEAVFGSSPPYEVGGLSFSELRGSTVELKHLPQLFVHAVMGLQDIDDAAYGLRELAVFNVDAKVAHLASKGYTRTEMNVVLSLEAQRLKQNEVRESVESLIESGELTLIDPLLHTKTRRREGALVRFDDVARLLFPAAPVAAVPASGSLTDSEELQQLLDSAGIGVERQEVQEKAPRPLLKVAPARTRRVGGDLLAHLVDRARASVADRCDTAAVMAELQRLARLPEKDRPSPLLGVNSGGIQWLDGGVTKTLTRKALGERIRRFK